MKKEVERITNHQKRSWRTLEGLWREGQSHSLDRSWTDRKAQERSHQRSRDVVDFKCKNE